MQKINYFEILEEISLLCTRAVYLTSGNSRSALQKSLLECRELQKQCIQKISSLEDFLFTDFLPPLERRSIAEAAHGMGRIIECSNQTIFQKLQRSGYDKRAKEADVCIKLAEILEESVGLLKKIKKPNQTPKTKEFRESLQSSRHASKSYQKKQSPSSLCTAELREELSNCFDRLIEIMLCNI